MASLNEDFPNFTVQENRGKALFVRHCSSCHLPSDDAHFFMTEPANTGLEAPSRRADGGVGDVTLRDADLGAFKAPSLRNVEVAGPYMHDGRLPTLEAVIDHYSNGFLPHPFLDSRIRALNFTASEKAALVQFLSTLTDQAFLTDPKFSDPFPAPPRVIDRDERQAMVLPAPPGLGLRPVVERIRSFDVDDDGRVAADELPHRLRHWVERGDIDGDRALDEEETTMLAVIRPLGKPSERARAATDARVVRLRFGGWAGSRAPEGLDGLLSDLKLAPETRKRVLALLSTPKPESELLPRAKALLTPEEYENLAAALARQQAVAAGGVRGVISGVAGGLRVAPPPPSPPPPPPPPPTVRRL